MFEVNYNAKVVVEGATFGVDGSCEVDTTNPVEAYTVGLNKATKALHKNYKNSVDNLYPLRFDIQLKNIKTNGKI